jgi:hypothetical protein
MEDVAMNYHPLGLYVWDSWYLNQGGVTHCFHLQQPRPDGPPAGVLAGEFTAERGAIGHAISRDLVSWQTLPTALYRGVAGSADDYDLWTGCAFHHDGRFHLFYTARSSREKGCVERIALATSEDGITWTKHPDNPVITPDPRWYHGESNPRRHGRQLWPTVDCRDLCVIRNPGGAGFLGFFAARRPADDIAATAVIGLCRSDDLVHWEQLPPCFAPGRYACIEVPDVFCLGGRWYLVCMTGNGYGQRNRTSEPNIAGLATIYAVADRPEGPYHEPEGNVLLGAESNQGFCGRTVEVDGERYLFYTQAERGHGSDFGSVSRPLVLRDDKAGRLDACWSDRVDAYLHEPLLDGPGADPLPDPAAGGSRGRWERHGAAVRGTADADWAVHIFEQPGTDVCLSADVTLEDARSAGLVFRLQGASVYDGAYAVLLDAEAGEVVLTQLVHFPRVETRRWTILRHQAHRLKVTAVAGFINVFVDEALAIQLHHAAFAQGRMGLFVEQGSASFAGLRAARFGQ